MRTGAQRMTQRGERAQQGDGLIGQVGGGSKDPDRPAVDDDIQRGGASTVGRHASAAHDVESTDRVPRPHALHGTVGRVDQGPAAWVHPEVDGCETRVGTGRSAFDHPNVRQLHAVCISRTVTECSPSTVFDAKSSARTMKIQPRPVSATSRIVDLGYTSGRRTGGGWCAPRSPTRSEPRVPGEGGGSHRRRDRS